MFTVPRFSVGCTSRPGMDRRRGGRRGHFALRHVRIRSGCSFRHGMHNAPELKASLTVPPWHRFCSPLVSPPILHRPSILAASVPLLSCHSWLKVGGLPRPIQALPLSKLCTVPRYFMAFGVTAIYIPVAVSPHSQFCCILTYRSRCIVPSDRWRRSL